MQQHLSQAEGFRLWRPLLGMRILPDPRALFLEGGCFTERVAYCFSHLGQSEDGK